MLKWGGGCTKSVGVAMGIEVLADDMCHVTVMSGYMGPHLMACHHPLCHRAWDGSHVGHVGQT